MKLLKSHVFWFVVLGIVIFVVDEQTSDPLDTIVVDAALERQVAALWAAQVQREPTEAEIASLVDDWVSEEIWRRESIRLSLDEEDEIIRRRMIQKMQFIAEQEAELAPTEEELGPISKRITSDTKFRRVFPSSNCNSNLATRQPAHSVQENRLQTWRSLRCRAE